MTHLVEMQQAFPKLQAAGIKLYAISYDEPDALRDFALHHGIEFPLLSDRDSRVIREYGILNTLIAEHEAPFYGIPFPGTYVVDESGVVSAKFFPRQIAMRESAETFIDSALGRIFITDEEPAFSGGRDGIDISVFFRGGRSFKHGLQRRIIVRFELAEGLHIYGDPVPDGMVATTIDVSGPEGLVVEPMQAPPTHPLILEELGAELQVWSGTVDFIIPLWAGGDLAPTFMKNDPDPISIEIVVRYQACDNRTCRIPRAETFHLNVPLERATTPAFPIFRDNKDRTSMNSTRHMLRMYWRSVRRRPGSVLGMIRYALGQLWAVSKGPGGGSGKEASRH